MNNTILELREMIYELGEDLEIDKALLTKLIHDGLLTENEIYSIMDNSLDFNEFKINLINYTLLETSNDVLVDKLFYFYYNHADKLSTLVQVISNCESELQLYVTIGLIEYTNKIYNPPEVHVAEFIYYGLMTYEDYVLSLPCDNSEYKIVQEG